MKQRSQIKQGDWVVKSPEESDDPNLFLGRVISGLAVRVVVDWRGCPTPNEMYGEEPVSLIEPDGWYLAISEEEAVRRLLAGSG